VIGAPRPEHAPSAGEGEPDPALTLLDAVAASGLSGLRRVEGPWGLLFWDPGTGELLLAVDRLGRNDICFIQHEGSWHLSGDADALAGTLGLTADPELSASASRLACVPAGATLYAGIRRLRPGQHLRLRLDGSEHVGGHGSWRVERRDRRPAVLVVGEFEERLKSVLRVLAEDADLILLAEAPAAGALLASALAQLPGPQPRVLCIPGLARGGPLFWQSVSDHFRMQSIEVGEACADVAGTAGVLLSAQPALQLLAGTCRRLGNERLPGARPTLLLSAAGFDGALPNGPHPVLRRAAWAWWREDEPPSPAPIGADLAESLTTRWKPRLDAATQGSGVCAAWPMLDETVCHFLANLPDSLRHGRPWSADLRRRVLRDLLPRPLRAALAESGAT
jgi:hypothetical protein